MFWQTHTIARAMMFAVGLATQAPMEQEKTARQYVNKYSAIPHEKTSNFDGFKYLCRIVGFNFAYWLRAK